MNMKKILALTIIALALFSCMSVASAGLFDFLGGGTTELANETYTFPGFTLVLPENATIFNYTGEGQGTSATSYYIDWGNAEDGNNGSVIVRVLSGDRLVTSADEYVSNWADDGAKSEGTCGDWSIINVNGVTIDGEDYSGYILAYHDGSTLYTLWGDDLDLLKNVSSTFKKV